MALKEMYTNMAEKLYLFTKTNPYILSKTCLLVKSSNIKNILITIFGFFIFYNLLRIRLVDTCAFCLHRLNTSVLILNFKQVILFFNINWPVSARKE